MLKRCSALVAGILLVLAGNARAQEIGASEALVDILFGSSGQGALDLDVVAALGVVLPSEAATFPLASSSGGLVSPARKTGSENRTDVPTPRSIGR